MFSDSKHIVKTKDIFDFELVESKYARFSKGTLIFKNSENIKNIESLLQCMKDKKRKNQTFAYLWVNTKPMVLECEPVHDAYIIQNDLHICITLDKERPMYKILCNALSSKNFIISQINTTFSKIECKTITIDINSIDNNVHRF